jgi:hypothetical protein
MFDIITRPAGNAALTSRVLMTTVSTIVHAGILTAVVLLPMWYLTPTLPTPSAIMAFAVESPAAPPPPPPPPPAQAAARRPESVEPASASPRMTAPVDAPSRVEPEKAVATAAATAGVLGGVEGGVVGGIMGGLVSSAPPPLPLAPPAPKPVLLHVGGEIKAPALIARVEPE